MNVLIAFDKFKDSMTAKTACVITADTLKTLKPEWATFGTPLADGGEGFCEILTEAVSGRFHQLPVLGPRFREQQALLGFVECDRVPAPARQRLDLPDQGLLAIVEMAQASGMEGLGQQDRNCLETTSFGTGELMAFAIEQGAAAILLGIGGSATSDLGLGALEALGLQFRDAEDQPITKITPSRWTKIDHFAGNLLHPGRDGLPPIRIACDVKNPLLGPQGAAAVYGPQKGLPNEKLPYMEAEGRRLAKMLLRYFEKEDALINHPGAGAAGGIGFGLMAAADARLVSGFDLVTEWLQLEKRVKDCDLIITGEGRFDDSSLQGKGPFSILEMARAAGDKSVSLIAGSIEVEDLEKLEEQFEHFSARAIAHPDWPLKKNLEEGPTRLKATLEELFGGTGD